MPTFAERLKTERKKKKYSQAALAELLGMKRENISNYERGIITNVPSEVLLKLAELLNVTTDYLLGKTDDKKTTKPTKKDNEAYFRIDKNGLSQEDIADYIEDVTSYAEMRKQKLMEKKKR